MPTVPSRDSDDEQTIVPLSDLPSDYQRYVLQRIASLQPSIEVALRNARIAAWRASEVSVDLTRGRQVRRAERLQGRRGRPRGSGQPVTRESLLELHQQGYTQEDMAPEFGLSTRQLKRRLRQLEIETGFALRNYPRFPDD